MKKIYLILVMIISIFLVSVCSVPTNSNQLSSLTAALNKKIIYVNSIENNSEVLDILVAAAAIANVNLSSIVVDSENPLVSRMYVYFADQQILNQMKVTPEITVEQFNQLENGIRNGSGDTSYKINIIDNDYLIEFIPFSQMDTNLQLGNIRVSAQNEASYIRFQELVNENGSVSITLLEPYGSSGLSSIVIIGYIISNNLIFKIVLVLLLVQIIYALYRQQRNDVIKKINGYSNFQIFIERCYIWIGSFSSLMVVFYPISYLILTRNFRFAFNLFIYYLQGIFLISAVLFLILIIMQLSLILINPSQILKRKINRSFYPSALVFKVIIIALLVTTVSPSLTDFFAVYNVSKHMQEYSSYFTNQYFLASSDTSQDTFSIFLQNYENYYNILNKERVVRVSVLAEEDNSSYGAMILANNTFINSLNLETVDNQLINIESVDEEIVLTTENQYDLVKETLESSTMYCFNPINNSCSHVPIYKVSNDTIIPTSSGSIGLTSDRFFIRTGYIPASYSDYVFTADSKAELASLNDELSAVLNQVPLKLQSYTTQLAELNNHIQTQLSDIIKTISIQTIILLLIISFSYQMMYEQFKQEISVKYINGISTIKSALFLFIPQFVSSLIVTLSVLMITHSSLLTILILLGLIICVELIGIVIFNGLLYKKVISNIKGG